MTENRRHAVLIGIDNYSNHDQLTGCCHDATSLADIIRRHENNEKNFTCEVLTHDTCRTPIDANKITKTMETLFKKNLECALFYFSGHCNYDSKSRKSYFIPQNLSIGEKGIEFDFLMDLANNAFPRINSTTIIIDSCNAGALSEQIKPDSSDSIRSSIGTGVTILASSNRRAYAYENNLTGGFFSRIIIDAMSGSASDLRGRVTPASLYAHTDRLLSGFNDQRPIYKANVQSFVSLRQCQAKIPLETLMLLPKLFPKPDTSFKLDPSFEPDRDNVPDAVKHIPVNEQNAEIFEKLQDCNRQGLVVPVDAKHMYYAAIESKACKLTELGKHYRQLAELDRF